MGSFAIKKMEPAHHQTKVRLAVLLVGLVKIVKPNAKLACMDSIVFNNVEIADLMKIVMWWVLIDCWKLLHVIVIFQHTGVCPNGCERSWTGDFCTEGMLCQPNPCRNSGRCEQLNADTFQCHCVDPFEGDRCQLGGCKTRPCLNWGQCSDLFEPNEFGLGRLLVLLFDR